MFFDLDRNMHFRYSFSISWYSHSKIWEDSRKRNIIQHQEDANCVPQDLLIMKFKEDVPALNKHHFYIKTVLVLIANRHIFGTVKLNLVMPVH